MKTHQLALLVLMTTLALSAQPPALRGIFRETGSGLEYLGNGWSLRSDGDRGWVSLEAGGAEFITGFAMQVNDRLITFFPDRNNISHDRLVGRLGGCSDGTNLVRFTPAADKPELELYVGTNEAGDHQLLMYLADGIRADRAGGKVVLSAPGGQTLTIDADLETGPRPGPGGERPAVVFPCKGQAANSYTFEVPAAPRQFPGIAKVRFDVHSSGDDPKKSNRFGGAVEGAQNPVYGPGTTLDYAIAITRKGDVPFTGWAELEVVHSLGQPHFFQRVGLANVTDTELRVPFQPKFHLPGVSEVWARLVDADGWVVWTERYRMAWDWPAYRPTLMVEPDFNAFWDATLAELRRTPLAPEATRVYEDFPDFELYDVTFAGWGGKRLHAMLFVPKDAPRPLPAIVSSHPNTTGFGIKRSPDGLYGSKLRHDKRFVTIVPLIRGYAPDDPDVPFNIPWWGPLEDRDTYVARSWYCAMVRAVDYLATRPDLVDMKRVIARGGSQGGALALVTAALDPRIAVCIADCPANCQPQEIMEKYPSFGPSRGSVPPGRTVAEAERMLSYYNPVNFCPRIHCPTYVGSNIGDLTVHSMGPLAAYHNLTALPAGQKDFYPGFTHAHGSGPGLGVKTRELLDTFSKAAP